MKELIRYLAELECTAGSLYAEASEYFAGDRELSLFLKDLERDEIRHYDIMNRITDFLSVNADFSSEIFIDPRAWKRLEEPLLRFKNHMVHRTLTRPELFDYLHAIEFSEWNHIFIYIIEVLKGRFAELHQAAGLLENHMNKVRSFVAHKSAGDRTARGFNGERQVRNVSILVIDDEPAMLNLLESYLEARYRVDTATDRLEAGNKLAAGRYDVVISDVHLPGSSGIDIYRDATDLDASLGKKFIFITGDTSAEYRRFFEEHGIPYLYKPVSLDLIEDRIREILGRT